MTKDDFWTALQLRLTRELDREASHRVDGRRLCMGVYPDGEQYDSDVIVADAHISTDGGSTVESYMCQLWLPPQMRRRTILDWTALLPPDSAHDGVTVDHDAKWIGIRAHPARRAGFV